MSAWTTRRPDPPDWQLYDHLRIELRDEGAGCLLVFTHVMADPSTADSASGGWQTCLDELEARLETAG
ncbi:SRPBCC domain-containing protein [Streptomyces sp. NPDC006235]|uniref:SRPBCC domain-containing protein n=1 Tax=Streptomyces sp. NPDC006235 TaxID=3156736 RepID=UPI0033A475DD